MHLDWRSIGWSAGLVVLCAAAPALAFSDHSSGDGSDADNERLLPGIYPAEPVLEVSPEEPYDPFFDVDWSVGLRGSYSKGTAGERFETLLLPSLSLEHIGNRSAIGADASLEVVRGPEGRFDIRDLRLDLEAGYALDSVTRATGAIDLSVNQPAPGTPGLASDVAIAAQTVSGGANLGISREFGRFKAELTGTADRTVYGPTTLTDGTVRDNWTQNYWAYDAGLRVGYQATPIFEVFGLATVGRDVFDHASPSLGTKADATDVTLQGGVTGRWNEILEASASTGVALRRFDVASLGEVVTQLYDASLTFTPDPTWRMTAGLATTVAPPGPNASGTTRVETTASAEIAYKVNSWLALRASAAWTSARFVGSTDTESGYNLGAGADYMVNSHTALSADYGFTHNESTTDGAQANHRVTVGVTLSR